MNAITVPAWELRRALTAVLPHVGTDDTLPVLCCVRFEAAGPWLYLTGTDRYSMGAARIAAPGHDGDGWAAMLDSSGAKAMRRMLKGYETNAALAPDGDRLGLTLADGAAATWGTQDGTFPDWRPLLHNMLTAKPAQLGSGHGMAAAKLSRFACLGEVRYAEPLGLHVTLTEPKGAPGAVNLPSVIVTQGTWFCGAVMPVRRMEADPAVSEWTALTKPAEAVKSGD